jgi:phosphohistidine phosphatase
LVERGFQPEIIATSPLIRCRETADIVADVAGDSPPIVELGALRPGSDLGALLDWTASEARQYERVAWVGHAPDVGRMAAWLAGARAGELRFAKGAVAAIGFAGRPAAGQGELLWFLTAKALGC